MHACSNLASILLKSFLPHLNSLKYPGLLMTGLSVAESSSSYISSIAYFLFVLLLL